MVKLTRRFVLLPAFVFFAFPQQPRAEESKSAHSAAAEEVLAFERDMEAAVVRGDVAYVDRVSASDLSFTHGDGWTTGGKPLLVDDRKTFLERVANKQYIARDLDSVKVE